ncbi:phage terminase large subunit [Bradyrhizobium septentrionale]|uniref:phage terminase large subunit n=1 Tax=Bradyrhizobium septentrionale TaxID=1404411 RepID=UPI001596F8F3|nr:phage terminase large subunit [Bradyrhizobium septentrionale]UGY23739.1 phage terminase large subunit [Bradyrhizobium septentrionale]
MPSSKGKRQKKASSRGPLFVVVGEKGATKIGHNGGPPLSSWGEKGATPAQEKATILLGGDQRHTCLVGGARSGKTTTLVRTIVLRALRFPGSRHVILRNRAVHADASVGLDTLPKVMKLFFPGTKYKHSRHPHNVVRFPNGSEIWIGGLDDASRADKILGAEYCTIFLNECSQISWYTAKLVRSRLAQVVDGCRQRMFYDINPVGKSHWTNVLFGDLKDPETKVAINDPENYQRMFINPADNMANLDAGYIKELENSTGNYRKRFWEGSYIDENAGALWTTELIESCRVAVGDEPEYVQTVVSIDPSGASEPGDKTDVEQKPKNDEIGIVVASLGKDNRVYLRADLSIVGGPENWGKAAIAAYHAYGADHIIAEINYGGDMVAYVIRSLDGAVPVRVVHAGKGKHVRAEPISTLYTRNGVRHVGRFNELEDQLTAFTTLGYTGPKSPDRADAWIWAVNDLALASGANSWIEYYKRLAEGAQQHSGAASAPPPEGPQFGFEITPATPPRDKVLIRVPDDVSTVYLMDGTAAYPPANRIIAVSKDDASAFMQRGWERVPLPAPTPQAGPTT